MIMFEERILASLKEVLGHRLERLFDVPRAPFLALATVISESVMILEERRPKVDKEVQRRETATGVILVLWHLKKEAPHRHLLAAIPLAPCAKKKSCTWNVSSPTLSNPHHLS